MAEQSLKETEQEIGISVNANSSANAGNNDTDENGNFVAGRSCQSPEESAIEEIRDHKKEDNTVTAGSLEDLQSGIAGAAGTGRSKTAETKPYGDTALNKGLESQAKDGEGSLSN